MHTKDFADVDSSQTWRLTFHVGASGYCSAPMDIDGAVAVVTGGANGIGRATALALAKAGADVVVSDVDDSGALSAAVEIEAAGRKALAIRTDVGQREDVEALVARATGWQGRIDLFLSNAGVGCLGEAHEFSVGEWESLIAINLMGPIWATRVLLPHMLERNAGHLAFVASGAGYEGFGDRAPYCVAKFGVVALAESLAKQLKGTPIRVSLIVPGAVGTQGWRRTVIAGADTDPDAVAERREAFARMMEVWPSPESMAAVIVEGIRDDRFHILQPYSVEPEWFVDIFRRRAADPDGFVLG